MAVCNHCGTWKEKPWHVLCAACENKLPGEMAQRLRKAELDLSEGRPETWPKLSAVLLKTEAEALKFLRDLPAPAVCHTPSGVTDAPPAAGAASIHSTVHETIEWITLPNVRPPEMMTVLAFAPESMEPIFAGQWDGQDWWDSHSRVLGVPVKAWAMLPIGPG